MEKDEFELKKRVFKQRDCMKESYKDEFEHLLLIQIFMDFFFFSFSQVIFAPYSHWILCVLLYPILLMLLGHSAVSHIWSLLFPSL